MATWNRDDSDLVIGTGIGSTTIGSNLTISNNEIDCASGDLLLDAASDLILDADSSNILLKDNGVLFGSLNNNSSELTIKSGSTSAINLSGANTTLLGSLSIQPVSGDGSNESFLVVDTGDNIVKKRTGAQVRSDLGISDSEIIDWTTNQGSTDIHQSNIPWANGQTFDNDNQGLVPNPGSTGTTTRYLREDGYFQVPPDTNTQLSTEQVQDIVGGMFSSNTETRINVTYDDTGGKIDLLVDDMTANTQNTTTLSFVDSSDDIILRNTTGGAGSGTDDIKFVAGSNITLTHTDADNITIASANTNQLTTFTISDGTTDQIIAHGNTLTFAEGEGINVAVSATDTVTISAEDATTLNKGVAAFHQDYFSTSNGVVSIKSEGVDTDEINARAVTYAKMQNITADRILGRITDGGSPTELTAANVLSLIGVEAGATADQTQADINGLAITEVGTITSGVWNGTAIAHAYIGNDAIEGDNLADNAVDSEHYTDGSIDHVHLSADAVDGDNIADDSINSEHYVDGSIDTAHIADDQVTYAKIQNMSDDRILGRYDEGDSGVVTELNVSTLKSMLAITNVENTALSTWAGTTNITTLASNLSLGGSPTTTTQSASDNSTKIATTAYVETAVSNLVDSAPGTLNTLNELAAALGDDASFSTTVTNSIATKAPLASPTFTGTVTMPATIARTGDLTFDVSGDITLDADGGDVIIVDNSPSTLKPSLQITSTDAGSYGPVVQYKHSSASPSNTDLIFIGSHVGKNDADEDVTYMQDSVTLGSVADGQETSKYNMNLVTNGTSRKALEFISYTDNTIDATIAYGAGSSTTIAGDLTITGGNITNAITFDSGITNAGTIAAGTWNGTAIADGKIASASTWNSLVTNATHTGDVTGATSLTIADDAVTYAKMQNMTDARMLGNNAGSDGVITEMTQANVLSFLGVAAGAEQNVQSDWNASSGDAQILNKPTLVTSLNDLSDVTYSSNDLTIASLDKIIFGGAVDFDIDGDVTFTENGASFSFLTLDYNQEIIKLTGNSGNTYLAAQIFGAQATITCDDTLEIKADDMHFSNSNPGTFGWGLNSGTYTEYISWNIASNTYKYANASNTADYYQMTVGANGETELTTVDNSGALAHLNIKADGHVEFDGCGVGFDLVTPTFNAADTDVDFRTGNKQMVTLTSNLLDLNLKFPATSGNFTILLKQDNTGSRTMAADGWLAFESDGTAATVPAVKFPGGTAPTLTTAANHVDIISFFWDADNQVCYGVASLDFQD